MPDAAAGGTSILLYILGGSGLSAILGLLYYVLRRTDRALERSTNASTLGQQAIQFTGSNMLIVSGLQQAIFMQGGALDRWEDWGVDVQRQNRDLQRELLSSGVIKEVHELPPPPPHLDLTEFFEKMPGVTVPEPKRAAPQPDRSEPFLNRLFQPPGGGGE